MSIAREHVVAAARGDQPMDLVVRGANLVNVHTAEIYQADIGIKGSHFAAIARYENAKPEFQLQGFREVDAAGRYAMAGFVDSHVHIESMMVPPDMFARAVLKNGTTTAAIDPHEIANVLGVDGVRYMVEASKGLPVRILTTIPSCVPPVPGLETSGAEFHPPHIDEMLGWDGVVGIAEIMDYPGVINHHARMAGIVQVGLDRGVVNEGHAPRVSGRWLQAYLAAGVNSDHESRFWEEILEKLRAGMIIHIRDSSFGHYVGEAAKAWEQVPHAVGFTMCTDDIEPDDVLKRGHMNRVVRLAIEAGIPAPLAVRYATLNGAQRYRKLDLGAVAPGFLADLVLVDSLESMHVTDVYVEGRHLVAEGELLIEIKSNVAPPLQNTMKLPSLTADDFRIKAPVESGEVDITTIEFGERGMTVKGSLRVPVSGGVVTSLPPDYCFISVTGRHGQGDKPFVGVLKGLGIHTGAHGTTVAHDSHNLVIAGRNAEDMLLVATELAASGGGHCLVNNGKVIAKIALPLAGLMTPHPVEEVSPLVEHYNASAASQGVIAGTRSPMLSLAGIALPVIPEVKITNLGLVHVTSQEFIPLFGAA
ncbi:MAG: adenine deaminase C-terminal domain-containing protein [Chloroflexota bacterium]